MCSVSFWFSGLPRCPLSIKERLEKWERVPSWYVHLVALTDNRGCFHYWDKMVVEKLPPPKAAIKPALSKATWALPVLRSPIYHAWYTSNIIFFFFFGTNKFIPHAQHQNKSVEKLENDLFAKKKNQRMCPSTVKRKACQHWDRLFAGENLLDILLFGKLPGVGSALHVVSEVFVGGEAGH